MSAVRLPPAWRAFWQVRTVGERRALGALAVVLLFAAIAQLAWLAWDETPRLQAEARQRRAELAHMQALAQELAQPAATTARKSPGGPALVAAISAEAGTLPGALTVKPGGAGVELDGSADFDALVAWLARLHAGFGLRPTVLELGRAAAPGAVTVHAELVAE